MRTDPTVPRVCLGLDPGLGTLGFGLVSQRGDQLRAEDYGVVQTPPGLPLPVRLRMLYEELRRRTGAFRPSVVAVERLYFGKNVTTAEMVWQARGVVLLFASQLEVPLYEPKPSEVKLAICGHGGAEKRQVQGMVQCLLGLAELPLPDDAADALAVAVAGLSLASLEGKEVRSL